MKNEIMNDLKWIFFGTSDFAAIILEEIEKEGLQPDLIVTTPDRPKGRKMELSPSPVKVWAMAKDIPILQPEKLKDADFIEKLKAENYDLFIVAAYGKIIPKIVLDIPKKGAFNIHPSLLPKYRGPSPLQYQILNDEKNLGVTIIEMDEEVDHGPIIAQKEIKINNWPIGFKELERVAAIKSAEILLKILAKFPPTKTPQDHQAATFTKILEKEDGLLDPPHVEDAHQHYLKYLAFKEWPGTYFFQKKEGKSARLGSQTDSRRVRLKIKEADYQSDRFIIKRVIPEGKKEMSYEDFLKGF